MIDKLKDIIQKLKEILNQVINQLKNKPMQYQPLETLKDYIPPQDPDLLDKICLAIRDYEGKPGDRNYRNCNGGNLRKGQWSLATGYDKDGFAIFATMEDGMKTLRNMIKNAASGLSQVYRPEDSLVNFFKKYSPSQDSNNPVAYATWVGERLNVNPFTFRLKDLLV